MNLRTLLAQSTLFWITTATLLAQQEPLIMDFYPKAGSPGDTTDQTTESGFWKIVTSLR